MLKAPYFSWRDGTLDWKDLQSPEGLSRLDACFQDWLKSLDQALCDRLLAYRLGPVNRAQQSAFLLELAPLLERFWLEGFQPLGYLELQSELAKEEPVLAFRRWITRALTQHAILDEASFQSACERWPLQGEDPEHQMACAWQKAQEEERAQMAAYLKTAQHWGLLNWSSVQSPTRFGQDLRIQVCEQEGGLAHPHPRGPRGHFDGYDQGLSARQAQLEADYCIYCHRQQSDSCAVGMRHKNTQSVQNNVDGTPLTGCPLEQHISEMNFLRRRGHVFAALAVVMVENPLCLFTGHRICHDCALACVFQKQTPVDIPGIESRVLHDVLHLPFGVEWYLLLLRWNPLRIQQYLPKEPTSAHVLVVGLGPAGLASLYHLWMEGVSVLGVDGMSVLPPEPWMLEPVASFRQHQVPLSTRTPRGIGGVCEYGITARWDKNLLLLIEIFLRRAKIPCMGGIRLGGSFVLEDAWRWGFGHVVLALGAGLPHNLALPGSLARGMRAANDFLMSLHLQGGIHPQGLPNMDIALPAVVVGGGLTGVDAATELQEYYVLLVKHVASLLEVLSLRSGFWDAWSPRERQQLEAWYEDGQAILQGAPLADVLARRGGVSVLYRSALARSPAYRGNDQELQDALLQGIRWIDHVQIQKVVVEQDHVVGIEIERHHETQLIPARTVLIAIGSQPNLAYNYEHRGTFEREEGYYKAYHPKEGVSDPVGMLTSYRHDQHRVSYVGDLHPQFNGSVVKALASAKAAYPQVMASLGPSSSLKMPVGMPRFLEARCLGAGIWQYRVHAPMQAFRAQAGQFFRLQPLASPRGDPLVLPFMKREGEDLIFLFREESLGSKQLLKAIPGDPIGLMGPTGVRWRMDRVEESTLLWTDRSGLLVALALAHHMQACGIVVHLIHGADPEERRALSPYFEGIRHQATSEVLMWESVDWSSIQRVWVHASLDQMKAVQRLRADPRMQALSIHWVGSVYGPMQCMMKGVCASCWQWQLDPLTGARTKVVFACSWQDQPLELIDLEHLHSRRSPGILERLHAMSLES